MSKKKTIESSLKNNNQTETNIEQESNIKEETVIFQNKNLNIQITDSKSRDSDDDDDFEEKLLKPFDTSNDIPIKKNDSRLFLKDCLEGFKNICN